MTLSIKNGESSFLIGLDSMFSVFMKGVPVITNFKPPIYIKHLLKLISYENDAKLVKFKRSPV